MEPIIILFILGLIVLVFALPIVAMSKAGSAQRKADWLEGQLRELQVRTREREDQLMRRLEALEEQVPRGTTGGAAATATPAPGPEAATTLTPPAAARETVAPEMAPMATESPRSGQASPAPAPPPLPVMRPASQKPTHEEVRAAAAKVLPPRVAVAEAAKPAPAPRPAISLEQFMGVKLFAWVGGLALFLGIVFFVKLSIERGWISPELRTAIGFVTGLALVAAGIKINANRVYAVLGQTLTATGIVVLYGMTFAAHAFYKFPVFASPLVAFGLMTLITATAFLLAVRLEAQVVAVLGMIGGFLTPILCSTGQDNPLGLFGYIALLDIGVLAVAKHRRWHHLTALAAAGTVLMQLGWFTKFFHGEGYAEGAKTWVAVAVFLGFAVLFATAAWWSVKVRDDDDLFPSGAALALCGSAMLAAFVFLGYGSITERPVLLYAFVLLINLTVMATAWSQPLVALAPALAAVATFAHLSAWTVQRLTPEMLPAALAVYLLFGLLHTAYGVLWQRRQITRSSPDAAWVPVATLLLMLLPVLHLPSVSLLLWPAILLADLAIIGLALVTRSLLPVFAALALTMLTVLSWLLKRPTTGDESLMFFLVILGGFGVVFAIASSVLSKKVRAGGLVSAAQDELARWLPVCSAVLPFVLLILATLQLHVTNPSPVFGLALLLSLFLVGLGRMTRITALPMAALLCVLALEAVWHARSFDPAQPMLPLAWYLGFYALFSLHPHLFRRQLAETVMPWATAALAGVGTFALVYRLVIVTWPNGSMGLLPAAFAVPALGALVAVLRLHAAENPARLSQLAWFGGVALFFVTLIFPIQFEKQWLTVAWAFEGAALCWLFLRVPHPGLRAVGAALLAVSFVRLAVNPAVLDYHVRGELPIWNWQLYAYGLAAIAQFLAAWWLAPPRHLLGGINLRAVFSAFGGVLLFLLLNIEIADAFTPVGSRSIAFEFSGNFARDMTYSIAWGLFSLALLVIGFALRTAATRYVGIGLLAVTLLKLFFHDLDNIGSGYRIGALMAVALIALAASFLYQRFLDRSEPDSKP